MPTQQELLASAHKIDSRLNAAKVKVKAHKKAKKSVEQKPIAESVKNGQLFKRQTR